MHFRQSAVTRIVSNEVQRPQVALVNDLAGAGE